MIIISSFKIKLYVYASLPGICDIRRIMINLLDILSAYFVKHLQADNP